MSFDEAATFTFVGDDHDSLQKRVHAALVAKGFASEALETTPQGFTYFRLLEPTRLPNELRGRYETSVGDIEAPPIASIVDPLECWFTASKQPLSGAKWSPNPSLPDGFRVLTRDGEPVDAAAPAQVAVMTTVPNARYLAFALTEAGIIDSLGAAYVTFS